MMQAYAHILPSLFAPDTRPFDYDAGLRPLRRADAAFLAAYFDYISGRNYDDYFRERTAASIGASHGRPSMAPLLILALRL